MGYSKSSKMIGFQIKRYSVIQFYRHFPITTFLIIIWTALFLYTSILFGFGYNENVDLFAGIFPSKIAEGQYWRLMTYGYLHNGWLHFLSNVLFLYFFAPPLEKYFQSSFYLFFHFITVVATGVAIYLFSKSTGVGASGFEYALLGFYLYVSLFKRYLIDGKLRTVTLILTGLGIITTLQIKVVSFLGHLSGLIVGFCIAIFYFRAMHKNVRNAYSQDSVT